MNGFRIRFRALLRKEFNQLWRDNSSLLIGIVVPIMLIFLMGYGLSMDVKNVPTAVVLEDTSPTVHDMLSFMDGSEYFDPTYVTSMAEAEKMMGRRTVDAIVRVPVDFTESLYAGRGKVQVILYGPDSSNATTIRGYIESGIGTWQSANMSKFITTTSGNGSVSVTSRLWFNDANTSTWYLVPGLMVMIMTLVGVFLTALVMAREWERGTLEAIFITPVRTLELVLAKMVPYFCVAMIGFVICLWSSRYCFDVPLNGSLFILVLCSVLYLFVSLGVGLWISAVTKNQFVACQMSLVVSLLPCMMLTGFLFDLRCVPTWISAIGHVMPPTYYMELVKCLFLAGNNWPLITENCIILAIYAVFFVSMALHVTKKRLE